MRIARIVILLALVLLLGIVVIALALRFNSQSAATATPAPGAPAAGVETVDVVVTVVDIKRGEQITEGKLTTVSMRADTVLETQVRDPKTVLGKYAARDLPRGIFLTQGDVVTSLAELPAHGSRASVQIPPGYVAISIPISRLTAVAYAIQPGDYVAVMATFPIIDVDQDFQARLPNLAGTLVQTDTAGNPLLTTQVTVGNAPLGRYFNDPNAGLPFYAVPAEPQRPRLVTQMLIPNAQVLYVGTFPYQEKKQPTPTPTPQGGEEGAPSQQQVVQAPVAPTPGVETKPPDVVTLIVTPQDAVTLKYLIDRQIVLTLALRSASSGENLDVQTEAVTLSYILDRYNVIIPAKLPYDVEPRIDRIEMPLLPNDVTPTPGP